jgi:hypothetical protein
VTTFENAANVPITRYLLWRASKALGRRASSQEASTRRRAWVYSLIRLLCHLGAFSALTIAGFAWSFIAGMVVLAICLLAFSALFTTSTNTNERR